MGTPTGDYPKDKVVLFLSDVFGIPLVNNKVRAASGSIFAQQCSSHRCGPVQLLVDDFARNGYRTIMPDLFQGDALPEDAMSRTDFDRASWIGRHGPESWKPAVDAVVSALQAEGVTWIGTTGYCFGAPPAWYLAFKGASKVTVVSHPSRLRIPEDLQVCDMAAISWAGANSCSVGILREGQGASVDQQLRDRLTVPTGGSEGSGRDPRRRQVRAGL